MRTAFSASVGLQIIGKLMPSAPISIGALASHGSLAAIRASGTLGAPDVESIMPGADAGSIGIRVTLRIAPRVCERSRHNWRRRFKGTGVGAVTGKLRSAGRA